MDIMSAFETAATRIKEWVESTKADKSDVEILQQQMTDLMYEEIKIDSFKNKNNINTTANTNNTVEIGSTINEVTLSWSINKIPSELSLSGKGVTNPSLTLSKTGNITLDLSQEPATDTTAWTLKAKDERDAIKTAYTRIYFYNGVYYGSISADATIDNATILALGKSIQSSKACSFKTTQESQFGIFVCPVSYGDPQFKIGETPLPYTWEKVNTEPFMLVNQHGYTNPSGYNIWRSYRVIGAKGTNITVV